MQLAEGVVVLGSEQRLRLERAFFRAQLAAARAGCTGNGTVDGEKLLQLCRTQAELATHPAVASSSSSTNSSTEVGAERCTPCASPSDAGGPCPAEQGRTLYTVQGTATDYAKEGAVVQHMYEKMQRELGAGNVYLVLDTTHGDWTGAAPAIHIREERTPCAPHIILFNRTDALNLVGAELEPLLDAHPVHYQDNPLCATACSPPKRGREGGRHEPRRLTARPLHPTHVLQIRLAVPSPPKAAVQVSVALGG